MDFLHSKVWTYLDDGHLAIPGDRKSNPYSVALWLWRELQQSTRVANQHNAFRISLSEEHHKIWIILDEWWNGRYHNWRPDDSPATVDLLVADEEKQEETPRDTSNSTYQSAMHYLFVVEMVWPIRLGDIVHKHIEDLPHRAQAILFEMKDKTSLARQRALKHAMFQMIAYTSSQERSVGVPSKRQSPISATLVPCPWLRIGDQEQLRKPLYLWDRIAKRTVETKSIPEKDLQYYCISHTWGRWRKEPVQVPDVPWLVPTNTRFDVLSLPNTFKNLDWPVRYTWFDLFCIPQEECPEQGEEIGKQAEIFRQAKGCVIWMHDVLSWELLEKAMIWLGLNYVKHAEPGNETLNLRLEKLTEELQTQYSNASSVQAPSNPWSPIAESYDSNDAPNDPGSRWFSSLWTLQEAYLCPSSLLADRNWNFLGIKESLLLGLDCLTSIAYSAASEVDDPRTRPKAVELLMFTLKRWELTDLTSPSRMSLIIAAESRVCTGPRAEAIMSALDARDWYESWRLADDRSAQRNDLVFGMYPLEFLKEVQRKIGGPFYLHHRAPQSTIEDIMSEEPLGTMLPLAYNQKYWQVTQAMNFDTTNWSLTSCDSWEIQVNGSVVVKEAAILYAVNGTQLRDGIDGPVTASFQGRYQQYESFNAWSKTLPDVPYRFAVGVVRYSRRQFGIVLEGMVSRLDSSKLALVKTGIFRTDERWCHPDLITMSPVDWVVL